MIRRTIAAVALSGALVLAPSAAFAAGAYPAPDASLKCDRQVTAVSTVVNCTVTGPNNASAKLQTTYSGADATIAGTVTSAPKTITNNTASFVITAPGITGVIGVTAIVNDVAITPGASVQVVAASTDTGSGSGNLPQTGFENTGLAIGAGAALVAGAAAVFVAARRRQAQDA